MWIRSAMAKRAMPECAEDDPARTAADELLLQDAFNLRKPILAICHGVQTLNVWRNGSLIQDLKTQVNHQPGREVVKAHPVVVAEGSRLTRFRREAGESRGQGELEPPPGDSHAGRQSAGDAVSPVDGVIEAVELDAPNHFVVGVQWHPERTYCAERVFAGDLRGVRGGSGGMGSARKSPKAEN